MTDVAVLVAWEGCTGMGGYSVDPVLVVVRWLGSVGWVESPVLETVFIYQMSSVDCRSIDTVNEVLRCRHAEVIESKS